MTAAKRPAPRPGILDIAAYIPGRSRAVPGVRLHKLSSNETPLGPSPMATEAYRAGRRLLELLPGRRGDGASQRYRAAYGLNPDRIICGAGSDEVLHLIANAYIGPGDEGDPYGARFLVYPIAIRSMGGTPVVAAERDLTTDVDAILARVNEKTRVVFVANPNNPTGTYLPFREVRRLHAALPPTCCLSSTRPMPSTCAATITRAASSSPGPPKMSRRR